MRHLLAFAIGFLSCFLLVTFFFENAPDEDASVSRTGGYQFVNPLLSCDINENEEYAGFSSLKGKLQQDVDSLVAAGKATRISVYFRNMDYGQWTGINADDLYSPASLMKVPLMVAYLKQSEQDKTLLASDLFLPAGDDQNASEVIKSPNALALGKSYDVNDLIDAMMMYSDNNAAGALTAAMASSTLDKVYADIGIPVATDESSDIISPKTYMRLFRTLYNASYIWKTESAQALQLMSQSDFKDGLVAGVPSGVTVSHKFGERDDLSFPLDGSPTVVKRELHDCGIVYYPGAPYGLCVMTEGGDLDALESAIAQISKTAYDSVDNGLFGDHK